MRTENVYVISQNPFWDLLHGHKTQEVRNFVEKYLRPIKERLEDIHGEARAESLIRMEYLDTANLYRLDERAEIVSISSPSTDVRRGFLQSAGQSIQRAKSQTEKMQILNQESQTIRRLIRSLNKVFIAVMEGKLPPISAGFRQALVEQMQFLDLTEILKPLYEIHVLILYGEIYHADLINPESWKGNYHSSKRADLFHEAVRALDEAAFQLTVDVGNTDIEDIEELTKKRLAENIKRYRNYKAPFTDGWLELKEMCAKSRREKAIQRYGDSVPLERFPFAARWEGLRQNLAIMVKSIRDLKAVCILLERPENHIMVRSNQKIERHVPARTVADMVNEMTQELTELPKYSAYAKVLQGKEMWKGE